MSTYVQPGTDTYANRDYVEAEPQAAQLQARSVSPIRSFEGTKGRYLIFYNPTRSESKGLYQQEGYELPVPPGKEVLEGYTLGRGAFGAFHLAGKLEGTTEKVHEYVGVKITEGTGPIEAEVATQEALSGLKNIMPSLDKQIVEKGGRKLLQVMPLAGLGNLETIAPIIQYQKDKLFQERLLFVIAHDLIHGLVAMHRLKFYHLDLKPANTVLNKQGEGSIIDFGCTVKAENGLIDGKTTNGDTQYFSPQRLLALNGTNSLMLKGEAIDLWAAGMSLYEISAGFPYNFREARNAAEMGPDALRDFLERSLYTKFSLPTEAPDSLGSFILHLLAFDESAAPTAEQALTHPWFQKMEREAANWGKEVRLHLVEMIQSLRRKKRGDLSMQDLPPPHFSDYLSRPQLETDLIQRLLEPVGEKATQTVIQGMGGLGKTQLTTYLVNHPAIVSNFSVILWLRSADEPSRITSQIQSYAREQGLVDEKATPEKAVQAFHDYLLRMQKPWLLVVDNADDPALIKSYFPPKGGQVLITSRSKEWDHVIPLPPFSLEESKRLTARLLGKSSPEDEALCQELGLLPLAIVQACAYIRSQTLTTAHYLEQLKTAPSLLEQNTELFGKELPKAVGALWQITLKKLEEEAPASLQLLKQLSYLSPEEIPPALLTSLADASIQEPLIRFALLQKTGDTFSVHRLLQKVVRASHNPDQKEELLLPLFFNSRKLYTFENATNAERNQNHLLLPHGEALLAIKLEGGLLHQRELALSWVAKEYTESGDYGKALTLHQEATDLAKQNFGEKHEEYGTILHYLSSCLHQLGRYDEALSLAQQALAIRQEKLGHDHLHVASSLNNLGNVFYSKGKFDNVFYSKGKFDNFFNSKEEYYEAINSYTKALKIYQEKLGYDHPHVASTLNNLGNVFYSQEKYKGAIDFYTKALKIYQEKLGHNHPHVASTLNNLGVVFDSQAKYNQAIESYTEALHIYRQQLGDHHLRVANSLNNLGVVFQSQGKYEAAIDSYAKALKIRQEKLGHEHPEVATSLNGLGMVFQSQGKYKEAIESYTKALHIYRQQLGPHHPQVAGSLNNLGSVFQSQGKYKEAIESYKEALHIYRQQLGHHHPQVAGSLNNLGSVFQSQKKYEEAIKYYTEALDTYRQQLGHHHPQVAGPLNNLGSVFQSQKKYEEAIKYYTEALDTYRQQLGHHHPQVAGPLNNLGSVFQSQGKYKEAIESYTEALHIYRQQLGPQHPQVAGSLNNLGSVFQSQENYKEAAKYYTRALEIYREQLGHHHPHVASSLNNLGMVFKSQGDGKEAANCYTKAIEIYQEQLGPNHPHLASALNNLRSVVPLTLQAKIFDKNNF